MKCKVIIGMLCLPNLLVHIIDVAYLAISISTNLTQV